MDRYVVVASFGDNIDNVWLVDAESREQAVSMVTFGHFVDDARRFFKAYPARDMPHMWSYFR